MSTRSTHNIGIVFTTQGAATVLGTLNRMNYGLGQVGQSGRRAAGDLGIFDRQLKAIGTTLRYAFAGAVVFGIQNVTAALKLLEDQISAIAGITDTLDITAIRDLNREIQDVAITTGLPRAQVQQAVIAAASGLPGSQEKNLGKFAGVVTPAAQLLMASPEETTRGIISLASAFGLDPTKDAKLIASQLIELQREAVIGTGAEIAQYIPQYATQAAAAGFTLPETMGIVEMGTRAGGSFPSMARWFNQFMLQMQRPQGKREEAWERMGLGFDVRSAMFGEGRGIEVVGRMMAFMKQQGVTIDKKKLGQVNEESMAEILALAESEPELAASQLGVTGGAAAFWEIFGRSESVGFALRLLQQWNDTSEKTIDNYKDVRKQEQQLADEIKQMGEIRTFNQLSEAVGSFRDELILTLEDGIRPVFKELTTFFKWAKENPVQGAVATGAVAGGGILAAILGKKGLDKILGGRLGKVRGPGPLGVALGVANIGGDAPTGSPLNPFFVVVMNPGGGGIPGVPGGRGPGPIDPTTGKPGRTPGKWGKWLRRGAKGGGILGALAIASVASEAMTGEDTDLDMSTEAGAPMLPGLQLLWNANPKIVEAWNKGNKVPWNNMVKAYHAASNKRRLENMTPEERKAYKRSVGGKETDVFDQVASAITRQTTRISGIVGGKETTETVVRLEASEELRKLIKAKVVSGDRTHVPAAGWTGGAIPTSRGRRFQTQRNAT